MGKRELPVTEETTGKRELLVQKEHRETDYDQDFNRSFSALHNKYMKKKTGNRIDNPRHHDNDLWIIQILQGSPGMLPWLQGVQVTTDDCDYRQHQGKPG